MLCLFGSRMIGAETIYECPWCHVRRAAADRVFWDDHRAAHPRELEALRQACIDQSAARMFDADRLADQLSAAGAVRLASFDRAVLVWHFPDAPEVFRRLSPHGGDEDFLALVPAGVECPAWALWWQDASRHGLPDGSVVLIGAHA
jgi:hypothetical protein